MSGGEHVIGRAEIGGEPGGGGEAQRRAHARALLASPFAQDPAAYDAWYDTPLGAAVLRAEVECLRGLLDRPGPAMEVGAGTGRFCAALGLDAGLDPVAAMLRVARQRGVPSIIGVGEALPVRPGSLAHVVMVTALEFVADAQAVMREAATALRPGGSLVAGFLPAAGAWAGRYREAAAAGDAIFATATFYTPRQVVELGERAGLALHAAQSTLFESPGALSEATSGAAIDAIPGLRVEDGAAEAAGFVAVSLARPE